MALRQPGTLKEGDRAAGREFLSLLKSDLTCGLGLDLG